MRWCQPGRSLAVEGSDFVAAVYDRGSNAIRESRIASPQHEVSVAVLLPPISLPCLPAAAGEKSNGCVVAFSCSGDRVGRKFWGAPAPRVLAMVSSPSRTFHWLIFNRKGHVVGTRKIREA
jgi:hypothetical protein